MLNRHIQEIAKNADLIMNTLSLSVSKTLKLATDLEEVKSKDRALTASLKALRPRGYQQLQDERSAKIREIVADLSKEQEANSAKDKKENASVKSAIQKMNAQEAEAVVSQTWEKESEYRSLLREYDDKAVELLDSVSEFAPKSKIIEKDLPKDASEFKSIAKYLIHLM